MKAIKKVAAIIPTKNVAKFIQPTLESLRFCDEVIVVDMFSNDDTRAVCEAYPNVRFFERQDFIYGNFNYGIQQASSEWIIRLDSDEVISPELQSSIVEVLNEPEGEFLHYDAICHLYFFGMRLKHGFGNHWRTTLFRKGAAHYKVESEHEGLTCSGVAGKLRGHYDHFTNPTLSQWIDKTNYYTDKDVDRADTSAPLAPWRVLLLMARNFRHMYLGKGHLRRDGYLGFVVSVCSAFALGLIEFKKWERFEKARLMGNGQLPDHPNAKLALPPDK